MFIMGESKNICPNCGRLIDYDIIHDATWNKINIIECPHCLIALDIMSDWVMGEDDEVEIFDGFEIHNYE